MQSLKLPLKSCNDFTMDIDKSESSLSPSELLAFATNDVDFLSFLLSPFLSWDAHFILTIVIFLLHITGKFIILLVGGFSS